MTANIGEDEHGINFIWDCVLIRIQKVEDGSLGKLNATAKYNHGTKFVDEFNTAIFAIGRDAMHGQDLAGGVALNPKNGKLLRNELEGSGVDNIYVIYAIVTTGCVYVCTTVREDNWKQL